MFNSQTRAHTFASRVGFRRPGKEVVCAGKKMNQRQTVVVRQSTCV